MRNEGNKHDVYFSLVIISLAATVSRTGLGDFRSALCVHPDDSL